MSPLEIAVGEPLEIRADGSPRIDLRPHDRGGSPRAALERAILPSLQRAPCGVAFSGGCDSSGVLAVAAHVARREGLPLPVPITYRFPRLDVLDESDWQELVVSHLKLPDWQVIEVDDELDVIGPLAMALHQRYGLLWPPAAHMVAPLLAAVPGGSLILGEGGDELARYWVYQHLAGTLRGKHRPTLNDARQVVRAVAGTQGRRVVMALRYDGKPTWLTEDAHRAHRRALALNWSTEPARYDHYLGWTFRPTRALRTSEWCCDAVAELYDVACSEPLREYGFLAAVARTRGRYGYHSRTDAMTEIFGTLLPPALLSRSTKAEFTPVYFNRHSKEFVDRWVGDNVDASVVDPVELRRSLMWSFPGPAAWTLLQSIRLQELTGG